MDGGTFIVNPRLFLILSSASHLVMFDKAVSLIDCLMAAASQGAS